ncbi:DUF4185 domain-containing protein [Candidatus Sumerlaeota bacterium]|nr:DUF4185 domain-containing protein [Candidatus Sumerlaeota bacterium]
MSFVGESYNDLRHITTQATELDCLFAPRSSGYIGADAALSIPLSDGRILWVFGDTLIGTQKHGKRKVTAMPRNTIAIQSPGPARPENIEWFLTNRKGEPADFFTLPAEEHNRWFWPGTGICINGELFLFGYGVTYAKRECEALSFRVLNSWVMRVRDTSRHPYDWQIEPIPIPRPLDNVWFCSSCLLESPFLYLLGVMFLPGLPSFKITSAVLARVRVEELFKKEHTYTFEYWCNADKSQYWSSDAYHLATLYQPGVTECSIFYDAPRERYLATTYNPRNAEFYITTAPSLTGPWSPPALIFREQNAKPVHAHLFYTLRMHPHLRANEDEMILTYVVNTRSISDLLEKCDVYYPRFLRIDLTRL